MYEKFLKCRNDSNKEKYKSYKNLFESIKPKSKKNYFLQKVLEFKHYIKKTRSIMKELTGKVSQRMPTLPLKTILDNKIILMKKT